ncbi:MAG: siphovirus ReqiPepy6 Gp37-like family protein [Coriobacteriia bacterium]|nr:siphovirus ReqiPepy6 Gp37-like family protein [Coriobacteriia bacterium]MCL2537174.1 siphovirus ReqiPepy6 Gp37-like family protein [Coriobacteriia bacterium]
MNLYLLDERGRRIGAISEFDTLVWRSNMTSMRVDAMLPLSRAEDVFAARYLQRDDCDTIAFITSRVLDYGEQHAVLVEACDPVQLLARRVLWGVKYFSQVRREKLIVDVVNACLMPVAQLPGQDRMIELFSLMNDSDSESVHISELVSDQLSWEQCYDCVARLLEDMPIRFYSRYVDGHIVPSLYEGVDRSNAVVFSPNYGDLSKVVYTQADDELCNYAVVGGPGEGSKRTVVVAKGSLGEGYGEMWVDAGNVGEGLTGSQLTAALKSRGEQALAGQERSLSLTGRIEQSRFQFGSDYTLGDRVGYELDGVSATDIVTEVEEVFSGKGSFINISVGKSYPTVGELIKKNT